MSQDICVIRGMATALKLGLLIFYNYYSIVYNYSIFIGSNIITMILRFIFSLNFATYIVSLHIYICSTITCSSINTLYTIHYTQYTIQSIHYTLYTIQFIHYTLYNQYTIHYSLYNQYTIHYTINTQYTIHYTLYNQYTRSIQCHYKLFNNFSFIQILVYSLQSLFSRLIPNTR